MSDVMDKNTLTTRTDQELVDRVDEFARDGGYDSRARALEDLIRTGLRESQSPVLARWRERAIEWAGLLGLFSVIFVAGGVVTPLALSWTLSMAGVLTVFAASLVGIVEVARLATGQSALGETVAEVLA